MAKSKLTDKQRAFTLEYPKDFNATKAAIRAGYSEKTARQAGSRLLSNVDILKAIENEYARYAMSLEEALSRMASIARGVKPEEVEDPLKSSEVIRALEIIMKQHGALMDRLIVDWRVEAEHIGLSPGDLFELMVKHVMKQMQEADAEELDRD